VTDESGKIKYHEWLAPNEVSRERLISLADDMEQENGSRDSVMHSK